MPSEFGHNRLMFRFLLPGLALMLLGSVSLSLSGCDWLPKPKPGVDQYEQGQVPADSVGIYFSKYQGSQSIVESVLRKLPADTKQDPLTFAVTELLKGPSAEEKSQGFYSEIPKGTKLLGITKDAKMVQVNLSSQFSTGGGSTSITQRFEELKRTIKAVDTKHEVGILVEGKPLETLGGEGLEVPGSMQSGAQ
jgi:spore germination protein GerM